MCGTVKERLESKMRFESWGLADWEELEMGKAISDQVNVLYCFKQGKKKCFLLVFAISYLESMMTLSYVGWG